MEIMSEKRDSLKALTLLLTLSVKRQESVLSLYCSKLPSIVFFALCHMMKGTMGQLFNYARLRRKCQ
jgi:hypothetical protein